MIRSEHLVKVLVKHKIISQELAEGLLERISQAPQPIEARDFAERLIERNVISRAIAENLLRQLAGGKADHATNSREPSLPSPPPVSPRRNQTTNEPPFETDTGDRASSTAAVESSDALFGDALPIPAVFAKQNSKFKKSASRNLFDSKLVLFGGTGVFLLLLLATILYFAIYRRGAEEYLNSANAARDSGRYPEAIREYEEYLEHFPTHSGTSRAAIRLSLSRMRLAVDRRSDWSEALNVAKEEIAKITREPDYREEAQPEFTAILPTLAEHLAEQAKTTKSDTRLAEAEEAVELVRKHVPASAQPLERLHDIQIDIDFTHREIAKDVRLHDTSGKVRTALEHSDISQAFELTASLQTEYPGIRNDPRFLEILRQISLEEKNAVRFHPQSFRGQSDVAPETPHTSEPDEAEHNVVILISRSVSRTPATESVKPVFAHAAGSVFALRSTDGTVLWKKHVGGLEFPENSRPRIVSLPIDEENEDVLFLDDHAWQLVRLDGRSGTVRFRCKIGEPFYLAEFPPRHRPERLYLSTRSGKLIAVDTETGNAEGYLQFPQRLETPPRIDPERNMLLLIARHTTMYRVRRDFGNAPHIESVYLGHLPGTIRSAPFFFGPYVLVAEQKSPDHSDLSVYASDIAPPAPARRDEENPNGRDGGRTVFAPVTSFPLRGVVDTAPAIDENRLFLASDTGHVSLFQLETDPSVKPPIRRIAEGIRDDSRSDSGVFPSSGDAKERAIPVGRSCFLGLFGQKLWVAGEELTPYDIRQSRSQLLPRESLDSLTRTLAPLQRFEEMFVRTFRYRGQDCVVVKSFSISDGQTFWETRLADPVATEPTLDVKTNTVRIVTQTGKLYHVPFPAPSRGDALADGPTVVSEATADLLGENRGQGVRAIVPLPGGYEAWLETDLARMTSIPIYDANPDNPRQFRFIPLTERISAEPIALGTGLLTPLEDGRIAWWDPRSGRALSDPFFVKLAIEARSRWTAPAPVAFPRNAAEPECVVLDRETSTLYHLRATHSSEGTTRLTEVGHLGDMPSGANFATEFQGAAWVVDQKNGTVLEIPLADMRAGAVHRFDASFVWGPYRVGENLVAATSQKEIVIFGKDAEHNFLLAGYPMPYFPIQGRPAVKDGKIHCASPEGTLWSIDPERGDARMEWETGAPLQAGPLFSGQWTILPGKDGCLYFRRTAAGK